MIRLMSIPMNSEAYNERADHGEGDTRRTYLGRFVQFKVGGFQLITFFSSWTNAKVLLQLEVPGVTLLRLRVPLLDIPVVCQSLMIPALPCSSVPPIDELPFCLVCYRHENSVERTFKLSKSCFSFHSSFSFLSHFTSPFRHCCSLQLCFLLLLSSQRPAGIGRQFFKVTTQLLLEFYLQSYHPHRFDIIMPPRVLTFSSNIPASKPASILHYENT